MNSVLIYFPNYCYVIIIIIIIIIIINMIIIITIIIIIINIVIIIIIIIIINIIIDKLAKSQVNCNFLTSLEPYSNLGDVERQ